MSKSPQNDTRWAGFPVTVKSLYNNLEGGEKSVKGCTLQLQLLHGKATELLFKGKSVFYFNFTECLIHLIILITCFVSSHLISLSSMPVSSSYKDSELSVLENPHDCYNQFILKKNPWWALYCLNRWGRAPQFYTVRASGLHLPSFYIPGASLLTGFVSQVHGSNLTLVFLKLPWENAFYWYSEKKKKTHKNI